MGYSIAVHCRTKNLQKKMTTFMEKHYQGWSKINPNQGNDYSRFASNSYPEDSQLSYDHSKLACGFDYNASESERDYISAVTRWMCLKVGARREFKGLGKAPCFFYDGGHCADDRYPVVASKDPDKDRAKMPSRWRWALGDEFGHRSWKTMYIGTPAYEDAVERGSAEIFLENMRKAYSNLIEGGIDKADALIRSELERLDKLWQEER